MAQDTGSGGLSGEVHVAAGARLEASVFARRVVIDGDFKGRVKAQALEFGPTAEARGEFQADVVVMREGAVVEGAFNLPETAQEEPARYETESAETAPVIEDALLLLADAELVTAAVN